MQDTTISFETAKLLKEKGFNYNNHEYKGYVNNFSKPCYNQDGKIVTPKIYNTLNPHYPAPSQSALQKWLREIHFINISIDSTHICHVLYKLSHYDTFEDFEYDIPFDYPDFEIYEEALEVGLVEALNLIVC